MSAEDIIVNEAGKNSEPAKEADLAEKGATIPAPYPAEDRPSKEKDIRKAKAMLDGKDPEFVELLDDIKDAEKLVTVVKSGQALHVNAANVDAHLAAGWKVAPEVLEEAREEKAKDEAKAKAEKAKSDKPTPDKPAPNPTPSRPTPVSPPAPRPTPPASPATPK